MKESEAVELKNEPTVQFQEIAKIFITSFDRPSFAEDAERATQETTQETTQEKILTCNKADPVITRNQTSAKVGLTEDGIKYHLTKLTKSGIIRHVGSTKAGRWEVKR
jgi:ATP-dependent DNA helicase RecG